MRGKATSLRARTLAFLDTLPSHAWVDDGLLAVAHAGVREGMLGKSYPKARDFGLYGDSSGRPAADGLPERFNWGADYRGRTAVVYGHTPVAEPEWLNNTMCIDTGCVFGGKLTALRWPERELVSVPAREALRRAAPPVRAAARAPGRRGQTLIAHGGVTGSIGYNAPQRVNTHRAKHAHEQAHQRRAADAAPAARPSRHRGGRAAPAAGHAGQDPRRLRAVRLRAAGDAGVRIHRRARQVPARPGPAERGRVLVPGCAGGARGKPMRASG